MGHNKNRGLRSKKMPKKKKEIVSKENVKDMSFADLHAMYLYVQSHNGVGLGTVRAAAQVIILERLKEIEDELYTRAYGKNPFKVVIVGQKPEEVIAKFNAAKEDVKTDDESGAIIIKHGEEKEVPLVTDKGLIPDEKPKADKKNFMVAGKKSDVVPDEEVPRFVVGADKRL